MTRDHHSSADTTEHEHNHNNVSTTAGAASPVGGNTSTTGTAVATTGNSGNSPGKEESAKAYKLASSERNTATTHTTSNASAKSNPSTASPLPPVVVQQPQPFVRKSRFLTTSRTIRLFGAGVTVSEGVLIPMRKYSYLINHHEEDAYGHVNIMFAKSKYLTFLQTPKPQDRIVYLAGAWDMFHAGHIEILENAKK